MTTLSAGAAKSLNGMSNTRKGIISVGAQALSRLKNVEKGMTAKGLRKLSFQAFGDELLKLAVLYDPEKREVAGLLMGATLQGLDAQGGPRAKMTRGAQVLARNALVHEAKKNVFPPEPSLGGGNPVQTLRS